MTSSLWLLQPEIPRRPPPSPTAARVVLKKQKLACPLPHTLRLKSRLFTVTFKVLQGLALPVFPVSLPKHSSLCFVLSKHIWPSCCVFRCAKNRSSLRTLCLLLPLPGVLFPSEIHGGCSHYSGKTLLTCDCPTRIQVLWGQGCFLSSSVLCP